ncbi:protein FAM234A isoform X2 [Varanus komodoensis]|uniref:protein FAM234A isoform X2 n=1 Tax=Varanus komodoensis TaxID=61221 RepID=UPI001CF79C13|nr:protein FAM234A isoform X2 [Varanus komodoensis]
MENKDLEAEIHPLKNEECKAIEGPAKCAEKEGGASRKSGRLSRWRTAAFFLSLFLCLLVVFAFSFIIPCPVRPISQRTWHRTYDNAATYTFLAVADVDKDRVQDVLFAFKAAAAGELNSSSGVNSSCSDAGFATPCAFVAAHSGTNGSTLWQRPVAKDLLWMDCSAEQEDSPACLLIGKPDFLAALDLETGQTLWQRAANFGANSTVLSPLLKVPDVSGDGVPDLLVFAAVGEEIKSCFHSGKDGTQIGFSGSFRVPGRTGHLLQVTPAGAHYVLFRTAKALYGYSLDEIYQAALNSSARGQPGLKRDPRWELAVDRATHQVSLPSSGDIHYLTKMPAKLGTNLLVARSSVLELVDGQHLGSVWVADIPHIMSEPVLGAYSADAVDVITESRVSASKKKVMIVESRSGDIKWQVELSQGAWTPRPASLATTDHRSAFLFWGTYEGDTNGTALQPHLYLFHPSLPNVLLDMSSSTEPIAAFEGVLFERSRHACYVLLTGPRVGSAPGSIVLSKRKLKEDVVGSRVIWLSSLAPDTEQHVRERFLRMRYRSLR